ETLLKEINALKPGQKIEGKNFLIARRMTRKDLDSLKTFHNLESEANFKPETLGLKLTHTWDIFNMNHEAIESDFDLITKGRKSAAISETNRLIKPENIFIEEGACVEYSFLNASEGPIYIGKNCEVMEGASVRGPFAMCEGAVLRMGARIYGAT